MTPDLFEEGARRVQEHAALEVARQHNTESGGRNASTGRIATPGEVDVTHGRILYLQDV
ncbi:MAG: ABC transporter ATP-binding protein, partial [Polaromonas sp.]